MVSVFFYYFNIVLNAASVLHDDSLHKCLLSLPYLCVKQLLY